MILNTLPTWLTPDGDLALPRHARLPLGLAQNSRLWALYRRRTHDFDQVMFSPYPDSKWADLWRLDMQMLDGPGQLLQLIEILDACKIHVLHQVSRNAFQPGYHFKYLMLDCTQYESPIDGDTEQRGNGETGLSGLRDLLLLEFLDVLRISADGDPKIRIERNLVHWNMFQAVRNRQIGEDRVEQPLEVRMEKNAVPLGKFVALAGPSRPGGRRYAVMSTNTKSHVIYCRLTNQGSERISHLAIFFEGRGNMLAQILSEISRAHLNILRSQIKQDLLSALDKYPSFVREWSRPFTLNVYVEAQKGYPHVTIEQHLKRALEEGPQTRGLTYVKALEPFNPELANDKRTSYQPGQSREPEIACG
jgi:hypothetical protein